MIQRKSYTQLLGLKPSKSSHALLADNPQQQYIKLNLKDVKVAGDDDECDVHLSDKEQENSKKTKQTRDSQQKMKILSSNEKKRTNGFQNTEDELVLKGSPFIQKLTSQAKSEEDTLQLTEKNLKNHLRNFSAFNAEKENVQALVSKNENELEIEPINNILNQQNSYKRSIALKSSATQIQFPSKQLHDISNQLQNQLQMLQEQPNCTYISPKEHIDTKKSSHSSFVSKRSQQQNNENCIKKVVDYSYQNSHNKDKAKRLAEEALENEKKECTFTPKINNYGTQRSVQEFLDLQNQFQSYVTQKKKQLKQQQEDIVKSHYQAKPKILKKSKNIAENKADNSVPVYARLYYMHRKQNENGQLSQKQNQQYQIPQQQNNQTVNLDLNNADKDNTFRPNIHIKSKSLVRYEKIEDILYKDAQRRQEKAKSSEKVKNRQKSVNQKLISTYSEKILIQRFLKEFNQVMKELFKNVLDNPSDSNDLVLDLAALFEVLIKMGFIKYQQNQGNNQTPILENEKRLVFLLWSIAGGEKFNGILKGNLCTFLLSVLGLNWSEETQQEKKNGNESLDLVSQYQQQQLQEEVGELQNYNTERPAHSEFPPQLTLDNNNFKVGEEVISPNESQKQKINQEKIDIKGQPDKCQEFTNLIKNKSSDNLKSMREYLILKSNRIMNKNNNNQNNSVLSNQKQINGLMDPIQSLCNIQLGTFDSQGHWILNEEDQKVIHLAFELLYRNRLTYEELRVNKYDWNYSFHPEISQASKNLASQYREKALVEAAQLIEKNELVIKVPDNGKITHQELLLLLKKKSDLSIEKKKNDIIVNQLQECSFHPNIQQIQPQTCTSFNTKQQQQNINNLDSSFLKKTNNNNSSFIKNNYYNRKEKPNNNNNNSNISFTKNNETATTKRRRNEELYALAKPRYDRQDKKTEDIEYERNADECTFKPNINVTQNVVKKQTKQQSQNQQQQVEKTIERMRSAKIGQDFINQMKEKGSTLTGKDWKNKNNTSFTNQTQKQQKQMQDKHKKKLESCRNTSQKSLFDNSTFSINNGADNSYYQPSQQQLQLLSPNQAMQNQYQTQCQLPQQSTIKKDYGMQEAEQDIVKLSDCSSNPNYTQPQEAYQEEKLPLLFVDVNLGPNKTERIVVYEGDKSEDLATKFAQNHGLDDNTKMKFKELLDNQIAGLLCKIDEEQVEQVSYEEQYKQQQQYANNSNCNNQQKQ